MGMGRALVVGQELLVEEESPWDVRSWLFTPQAGSTQGHTRHGRQAWGMPAMSRVGGVFVQKQRSECSQSGEGTTHHNSNVTHK